VKTFVELNVLQNKGMLKGNPREIYLMVLILLSGKKG